MPLLCPHLKTIIGIFCTATTIVLWALCIWQLIIRFAPVKTPPMEPSCFCHNNGICSDGICLCPEEWVGMHCEIVNFCDSSTYKVNSSEDILSFEIIIVGRYGYSIEKCDNSTANRGTPKGTRMCTRKNGIPTLLLPSIMDCNVTLLSLSEKVQSMNESATAEITSIATDTQILTSKPKELKSDNISLAASIADKILNLPSHVVPGEAAAAAVATVSQLLDANKTEFSLTNDDLTNSTISLTMAMQNFSVSSSSLEEVVQPNVAVRRVDLQESSAAVLFCALKGSTNGLVSDRIIIEEQASSLKNDITTEIQILISVTNATRSERAGFVLYQNDRLFPSKIYRTGLEESYNNRVISGNINGTMVNNVKIALSPQNFKTVYKYSRPLTILSQIGCGLSIAGLIVTIVVQIWIRKSRKMSTTLILVSLCSALLIFDIIFIFGIENTNANQTESVISAPNTMLMSDIELPHPNHGCTVVAALLHYFLLATFTWTALNSRHLYLLLVKTQRDFSRSYNITMLLTGWGGPALVVSITVAVTVKNLNYRQEEFCWLAALEPDGTFSIRKPMLWSFLLPVAAILLFNIAVFVKITYVAIWKENKNLTSTKKKSHMMKVSATLSVAVILGIAWILGYLMLIDNEQMNITVTYFFCIFNATQGLQIFFFHVLGTPAGKKKIANIFVSITKLRIYLHSKTYSLILHIKQPYESFKSTNPMRDYNDISLSSSME